MLFVRAHDRNLLYLQTLTMATAIAKVATGLGAAVAAESQRDSSGSGHLVIATARPTTRI
jgi:hypothetical protein